MGKRFLSVFLRFGRLSYLCAKKSRLAGQEYAVMAYTRPAVKIVRN